MELEKLSGMTIITAHTSDSTLTLAVKATNGRHAEIIITYEAIMIKPMPEADMSDDFIRAMRIIHEEDK